MMRNIGRAVTAIAAAAVALLAGCSATPSKVDPIEPFNRSMYEVHQVLDGHIVKPIAEAYVATAPKPVQTGLSNFFGNIDDLFSGINHVLQGNGTQAGDDFGRVLVNTMFSLGFLDIASEAGIQKDKTDFGVTLGKWGVADGAYLFIPLLGPTTVRDGAASIPRAYATPYNFLYDAWASWTLWGLNYLEQRAAALQAESVIDNAALDRYRFIRRAYLNSRHYQITGKPDQEDE